MDSMAGSFSITMALDHGSAMDFVFPDLGMGQDVVIYLDGKVALTGRVDKREGHGDASSYRVTITGRSKTASLVDGSAVHKTGQFDRRKPGEIISEIVKPYGISLRDEKHVNEILKRFIIRDGETAERAIRRVSREFGLVPFDDEYGNLVIQDVGAAGEGVPFVVGNNILSWSASQDMSVRHSEVRVKGQGITDDGSYGRAATEMQAAVSDDGVRAFRPLIIPFWGDATRERVKRRARIEALRRQGESINVSVTVAGLTDPMTGMLYAPNVMHRVVIPIDGVDNALVTKSVTMRLGPDEVRTDLTLVPEKAFSDGSDSGSKAKGGKSAAKRKRGGRVSGADSPQDDARMWYDAFEQVKDLEVD